ncbi:hypothetical protein [Roseibium litorale]|uniref:Uncharacterized protein n=1 Tax=Roseibium litorale TaxID=2803841 RepID=A0ABR9CS13_9HYPH|nr:hypothetical protein [Roseibium litorale]MBD8893630.1 hypothetical protein [Roseibium litorale]
MIGLPFAMAKSPLFGDGAIAVIPSGLLDGGSGPFSGSALVAFRALISLRAGITSVMVSQPKARHR